MKVQATTEQSIRVLNENIIDVALKADIERKLLLSAGRPRAAESIGGMMRLIWKLFRCCKGLQAENVRLCKEAMHRSAGKAYLN